MPEVYEIAVFEGQDLCYSMTMTDNIIWNYMHTCAKYMQLTTAFEADTTFNYGRRFVSYHHRACDGRPMMVMLMGPVFTATLIEDIRAELKRLHT